VGFDCLGLRDGVDGVGGTLRRVFEDEPLASGFHFVHNGIGGQVRNVSRGSLVENVAGAGFGLLRFGSGEEE